jgi:hypothetical protein
VVCWPFNESRIILKVENSWEESELELTKDIAELQEALKQLGIECMKEINSRMKEDLLYH